MNARVLADTAVSVVEEGSDYVDRDTVAVEGRSDGLLIRGEISSNDIDDDDPVMLLQYPVEEGTTYQHTDGEGTTFRIDVTRESVTVPAGEYDCLRYVITDLSEGDRVAEIWVKPGMGPVRLSGEDVWELTSTNVSS